MACKPYKDTLIEAAATGAEPLDELRAHLAACAACRAAFAEEQSLFSSIDAGLRATANAEVPASLLPRVRARVAEEAASKRGWTPSWLALAGAAALVVAFITVQAVRRSNLVQKPVETATQATRPAPVISPSQGNNSVAELSTKRSSASQSQAPVVRNFTPLETLASRNPEPEVLVTRDQEALLVSYAQQWKQRKRAPLVAASSDATKLSPLQIAPIQIAQLDVKLLTEEQAQ